GGLVAQDEPVAAHDEHRLRQHDLRPAGVAWSELGPPVEEDDLTHDLGRTGMEADPVMARYRALGARPDLHPRVEALGQAVEPFVAHDVSTSEVASLDTRQVHRHALAVFGLG